MQCLLFPFLLVDQALTEESKINFASALLCDKKDLCL